MAKAIARGRCIFMLYLSKVKRNEQKNDRARLELANANGVYATRYTFSERSWSGYLE